MSLLTNLLREKRELPINNLANLTVMNALHQELKSQQLPPIELMTFDGNPSQWPEFIADFKERVKFNRVNFKSKVLIKMSLKK